MCLRASAVVQSCWIMRKATTNVVERDLPKTQFTYRRPPGDLSAEAINDTADVKCLKRSKANIWSWC